MSEGIRDERKLSDHVKAEQEILAIIGNPPYRRLEVGENETLVGRWMDGVWDDLKKPVRDVGKGNQLNTFPELSVAFWRWSMWKLFEAENAPKRGVIAFITNRKFLTGWPYAGLRKMMRERFDRIEIIDLRGDARRGERAGVGADQGVFNIQVGTCITLAIADGSKAEGALAEVSYNDAWMHNQMSRKAKLGWMLEGEEHGTLAGSLAVERDVLDDLRPTPFFNGVLISLADCFLVRSSGLESKRDHVAYGFSNEDLKQRIDRVLAEPDDKIDAAFNSTGMNPAHVAKSNGYDANLVRLAGYRPLDRRRHYNSAAWNDRPRPLLAAAWGQENVALFAMPSGTNFGPSVWAHGSYPDRHAFRGSYGGYAFPLHDRRPGHGPSNLKPELIAAMADAYGAEVTPEAVFDVILCLLSATSYTTRFAEDLEDVFPHIPFPADRAVFDQAVRVGAEIRAVETFARPPSPAFLKDRALAQTAPTGDLGPISYDEGTIALCADGSGKITGIPQPVWDFSVSGYYVLRRWLAAREGIALDDKFIPDLRDLVGRIAELIDLFVSADSLLVRTLDDPLSRATLGLAPDTPMESVSDHAAPES